MLSNNNVEGPFTKRILASKYPRQTAKLASDCFQHKHKIDLMLKNIFELL